MKDEMRTNQEKMDAKIDASQEKMEGNNEKFEVLRGTLVSRMDIHEGRTMSIQEDMITGWIYVNRIWRPQ
jgi:peptidoglycan hydrolase CwlO-like protein